mmetsp:Transcript_151877/g.368823  ORF Transcript_151877/g.368823 Transcript_151877/m.368823 type:complete len:170 (+) Transcript_151877:73-582(+)
MALTRVQWLSLLGLVVSAYATYVEHAKQADPGYVAACDLSYLGGIFKSVSCSKVFASEYGRILSYLGIVEKGSAFDKPNAMLGILYYVCAFMSDVLRFIPYRQEMMFAAALFTSLLAFYLAYLLIFKLGDFCIVCASTYVANWLSLWAAWGAMKKEWERRARRAQKKSG